MRYLFDKVINIGKYKIGKDLPVFIIAEAGLAHFGDINKAKQLVDLAVDAGADAVKFQVFKTEELIAPESTEWRKRFKPKELTNDDFIEIKKYCEEKKIIFFATPHDEQSLNFLDTIDVPAFKIGSGEVKNWEFINKVSKLGKPVILSTGMYELDDIGKALDSIRKSGNKSVAILHCVTSYPTSPRDANLKAIKIIRGKYNVVTGYSDHTEGYHFPLAAVAMGAKIIEKHISIDFNVPNAQDWKVSCGPHNFKQFIKEIREIEIGIGTGDKSLCSDELQNIAWARKSIVAKTDIDKNEIITEEKLCTKRPGTGIPPSDLPNIIGKISKRKINRDMLLSMEDFK